MRRSLRHPSRTSPQKCEPGPTPARRATEDASAQEVEPADREEVRGHPTPSRVWTHPPSDNSRRPRPPAGKRRCPLCIPRQGALDPVILGNALSRDHSLCSETNIRKPDQPLMEKRQSPPAEPPPPPAPLPTPARPQSPPTPPGNSRRPNHRGPTWNPIAWAETCGPSRRGVRDIRHGKAGASPSPRQRDPPETRLHQRPRSPTAPLRSTPPRSSTATAGRLSTRSAMNPDRTRPAPRQPQ